MHRNLAQERRRRTTSNDPGIESAFVVGQANEIVGSRLLLVCILHRPLELNGQSDGCFLFGPSRLPCHISHIFPFVILHVQAKQDAGYQEVACGFRELPGKTPASGVGTSSHGSAGREESIEAWSGTYILTGQPSSPSHGASVPWPPVHL